MWAWSGQMAGMMAQGDIMKEGKAGESRCCIVQSASEQDMGNTWQLPYRIYSDTKAPASFSGGLQYPQAMEKQHSASGQAD
jgi:hypothetical protein